MEHRTSSTELYTQAMKLNAAERATLAGLLLESLESHDDDGVDAAWREEIERRIHELDQGTVTPVAWEQVRARLHGAA
jgi:putative addiction module component (TIGR02574 family)